MPVTYAAPVTSGGVAPVQVTCTRPSGSIFAVGETSVQCAATDAIRASASCFFIVTVATTPVRLLRTRFLAFGDSLTAGEVTVPVVGALKDLASYKLVVVPSAAYPTVLATLLRARYPSQAAAVQVANAGQPGEWAEDGAKRLPGVMSTIRPEVLLLLHGVNDLASLGQAGVSRAWQGIDAMAKEGRLGGARVFIATMPPSRPGGLRTTPIDLIRSLNDRIRITAAGEGAALVDVFTAMLPDVARYVGIDGLHLTEAGYQRLAELFFEAVRLDLEVR